MGYEAGQRLTDEQWAIVRHDPACHATVLAVAGSGKTTTMVHRIGYLVRELGVQPAAIRALMFNRLAREDFEEKLARAGIAGVRVQTFHSLGHHLMRWAEEQGHAPVLSAVTEEGQILARLRKVVRERRRARAEEQDLPVEADPEDVWTAIQAWKGMMTPPEEALHRRFPEYVEIYRKFEAERLREKFRTFDDMIYEAVRLLEENDVVRGRLANRLEHLIVDEFQDVNHAQQRLVALLAGERARVTVVGDDDQCIYEWRGARPSYLKREFQSVFTHHPHVTLKLTKTFRFGPLIAQIAQNVISQNTDRVEKTLVAADVAKAGVVVMDAGDGGGDHPPYREVVRLLRDEKVPPAEVVVLVRKYVQSYELQTRLVVGKIPFRVTGERAFVEHHPVRILRHYLSLAAARERPLDEGTAESLCEVVNVPNRYVNRVPFSTWVADSLVTLRTVRECLRAEEELVDAGVNPRAARHLRRLDVLLSKMAKAGKRRRRRGGARGEGGPPRRGYPPLESLFEQVDFEDHFAGYQGETQVEASLAMQQAFSRLLAEAEVPLGEVDAFVRAFDTTRGRPVEECLLVTSVFRAKGLEWDHVVLPEVQEGHWPHLFQDEALVENRLHPERSLDPTELTESERRLFYVAVTRARKSVFVHAGGDGRPSRFVHECLEESTRRAIPVLVHVLTRHALPPHGEKALLAAAAHEPLKSGMLKVLGLARADDPGGSALLESLAARLNAVPVLPFAYPEAFGEPPRIRRQAARGLDRGLPF